MTKKMCIRVLPAIAATAAALAASSTAGAASPADLRENAGGYALTTAKNGQIYYFGGSTRRTLLIRGTLGGEFEKVNIPQLNKLGPRPRSICIGGDGLVWASVYDKSTRRTTVFRVSGTAVRSRVVLPRGLTVSAMASDTGGRTWFLGRKDGRVSYFTRNGKLRSVKVDGSASLDSITAGDDGSIWAAGAKVVKRITATGVKVSAKVASTATAEIEVANGYAWVTAVGGVQRVSKGGTVTLLPLQRLKTDSPGTDHTKFVTGKRMSTSLFRRPDGLLGFTAGAVEVAVGEEWFADTSVGRIDPTGVVSETYPWGSVFSALTDLEGLSGRTPGATQSTVDSNGNLWLAEFTDLAGYAAGTW